MGGSFLTAVLLQPFLALPFSLVFFFFFCCFFLTNIFTLSVLDFPSLLPAETQQCELRGVRAICSSALFFFFSSYFSAIYCSKLFSFLLFFSPFFH